MVKESLHYAEQKKKGIAELLLLPYTMLRIKNLNENYSLEELVDFSFDIFSPSQIRGEILELLKILDKMKPKIVLEIGTARGGTLFLFSRVACEDAVLISIDLPHGMFGEGYPKWKTPLYKSFALPNQKIHLIRADSHNQITFEKVKSVLNRKSVDFLFIDGDHTYEGVKKDFEIYTPLVKNDGIIVFHDIVVHPPETTCEVSRFWSEIKEKYKHIEIVKDRDQRWAGIGLLFVG